MVSALTSQGYGHESNVRGAGGIPPRLSACANSGNQARFSSPSRAWERGYPDPLPRTILSASVHITDYQRSGCRWGCQESICVRSGPNPDSIIGEANLQNPSLQQTCHLDFLPKLGSNSIFKSQPAEVGGARQSVDFMAGWARLIQRNSSAAKIPMHIFFILASSSRYRGNT